MAAQPADSSQQKQAQPCERRLSLVKHYSSGNIVSPIQEACLPDPRYLTLSGSSCPDRYNEKYTFQEAQA